MGLAKEIVYNPIVVEHCDKLEAWVGWPNLLITDHAVKSISPLFSSFYIMIIKKLRNHP